MLVDTPPTVGFEGQRSQTMAATAAAPALATAVFVPPNLPRMPLIPDPTAPMPWPSPEPAAAVPGTPITEPMKARGKLPARAAAVALAEGGLSGKKKASSKAVKSAGKAAAAAIGARLLSEFTEVTKAAKAKPAKPPVGKYLQRGRSSI